MPGADEILGAAVRAYEDALGDRLLAAYALGSLAHGGFSPLVSDVDLGLVVADPLRTGDEGAIAHVARDLARADPGRYARLSVFWGSPATLAGDAAGGRFPPLDRLDLLHHGRLLSGRDARENLPEPSRGELVVSGAEFALELLSGDEVVALLHRPDLLVAEGTRRVTKLVLFPARFVYTAETGLVGANDAAAARYAEMGRTGAPLVAAARGWRSVAPERAEALALLERHALPLYRAFADDHRLRLGALARSDLAAALGAWRRRLDGP